MSGVHEGAGAYGPTSLDYISLPNPVEPHAAPHKHPLHTTSRLDQASSQDLRRLILEGPHKRRKCGSGDVQESGVDPSHAPTRSLPKPKLPAGSTKRMRIPPTLSGLHQPPPDARVLPSINVEKPQDQPELDAVAHSSLQPHGPKADDARNETDHPTQKPAARDGTKAKKPRPTRNRWSPEETKCLLDGVSRFGIGKWTQILKCDDYKFEKRTAIDLKDRFRVCRPDDYEQGRSQRKSNASGSENVASGPKSAAEKPKAGPRAHRMNDFELRQLGFGTKFAKSERRQRQAYTAEEDEAILKGFMQHGKKWFEIQQDDALSLAHRTSTDIRDRVRTRYPEHYAKVCTARPSGFPNRASKDSEKHVEPATAFDKSQSSVESIKQPETGAKTQPPPKTSVTAAKQKPPTLFRFDEVNDVFFGAPFEDEETDTEPVTLDRGILDWAIPDASKAPSTDTAKQSIDPSMILKRPTPASLQGPQQMLPPFDGGMAPLPSLADITSGTGHEDEGQLELPSLMQYFGSTDSEARGGHIPTIEELLS
ncbi:hypothetical protein MBLNU230_g6990t1 [Neophaeotheca triangularis]